MPLSRALLVLAVLYFGPFLFLGSLLCPGEAQSLASREKGEAMTSLVPDGEPGEPLRVTGRVFDASGEKPLPGVELRVYQTDAEGYYSEGSTDSSNPRLQGQVRTDTEGRFELQTILPGRYPGGGVPAHIHFVFPRQGAGEQRFELQFEGDPELRAGATERSRELGRFGSIRPLERGEGGIWHCSRDFKLSD